MLSVWLVITHGAGCWHQDISLKCKKRWSLVQQRHWPYSQLGDFGTIPFYSTLFCLEQTNRNKKYVTMRKRTCSHIFEGFEFWPLIIRFCLPVFRNQNGNIFKIESFPCSFKQVWGGPSHHVLGGERAWKTTSLKTDRGTSHLNMHLYFSFKSLTGHGHGFLGNSNCSCLVLITPQSNTEQHRS